MENNPKNGKFIRIDLNSSGLIFIICAILVYLIKYHFATLPHCGIFRCFGCLFNLFSVNLKYLQYRYSNVKKKLGVGLDIVVLK